ncbi:hypothetical protein GPJ56_002164 [Histomonas meleagridis]|uniref:uncharacterized protein n=1 Tax=Histomonas meleagridis TaxID=135588 RepID=UPI00355A595C|nr:hypothetical protein GPJ56_002164 [Histomonas meleagridis]KAH0806657.1 hypothetical protein GO595_000508 [Histomonas meleagridis]
MIFEILAIHNVTATFDGIEHRPCMFRTALCPDRCNHAKDLAVFTINEYINYEKKSEYGDEKQEKFYVDINPNAIDNKQDPQILEFINNLKKGDKVKILWEHIYVNNEGNMYPERQVRKIEFA